MGVCLGCFYVACRTLIPEYKYTPGCLMNVFGISMTEALKGMLIVTHVLDIPKDPRDDRYYEVDTGSDTGVTKRFYVHLPALRDATIRVMSCKDEGYERWFRDEAMDEKDIDTTYGVNLNNMVIT